MFANNLLTRSLPLLLNEDSCMYTYQEQTVGMGLLSGMYGDADSKTGPLGDSG